MIWSKEDITKDDCDELLLCIVTFNMPKYVLDVFSHLCNMHSARRYLYNLNRAQRAMIATGKLKTFSDKAILTDLEYSAYAELIRRCVPTHLLEVASGLLDLHWRRKLVKTIGGEYFKRLENGESE